MAAGASPEMLRVLARIQEMRKRASSSSVVDKADPKLREWRGFTDFCRSHLKIVDMEKNLIPLAPNRLQRAVIATEIWARRRSRKPHILVLKYRKGGVTTIQQALSYWTTWARPHQECITLAHRDDDMRMIWRMVRRFYDNQPPELRHAKTTAEVTQIEYPAWDALYTCGVVGKSGGGRGSTFSRVHIAEAAHCHDLATQHVALAKSIGPRSAYVLESTPNGREGNGAPFFEMWQAAKKGQNDFIPLFYPWWSDPGNRTALVEPDEIDAELVGEPLAIMNRHKLTKAQMKWWLGERRTIVATGGNSAMIHQEHPSDDDTCFVHSQDCYYDLDLVAQAEARCKPPLAVEQNGRLRIWELPDPDQPADYVIGCDPSGGTGNDDAGVVVVNARTGRQAATYQSNRMPPDELGRQVLNEMGHRWSNPSNGTPAFIVVEANNHGHATLTGLLKMALYPVERVYHQTDEAKVDHYGDVKAGKTPGWTNNIQTHADLTAIVGRVLREASPQLLDVEVVRSIRQVGMGPTGAVFSGRDLAVAAGLAAIGYPYARTEGAHRIFAGGRWIEL